MYFVFISGSLHHQVLHLLDQEVDRQARRQQLHDQLAVAQFVSESLQLQPQLLEIVAQELDQVECGDFTLMILQASKCKDQYFHS